MKVEKSVAHKEPYALVVMQLGCSGVDELIRLHTRTNGSKLYIVKSIDLDDRLGDYIEEGRSNDKHTFDNT
jgi:hypothetical protein